MNDSKQKVASTKPVAQRGWFRRNWKKIPLYILLIALLGAGIFCGVQYFNDQKKFNSKPYQEALDIVKKSARVIAEIGEPIEHVAWRPSIFPKGSLEADANSGKASFAFDVTGPKGLASVITQAHAVKADDWGIDILDVVVKKTGAQESDKISLKDEADKRSKPDAPLFNPNTTPDPKKEGTKPEVKPIEIDL